VAASQITQLLFKVKKNVIHDCRDALRNRFDERYSKLFHEKGAGSIFGIAKWSDNFIADFRRYNICPLKLSAAFGILDFYATQGTSMFPNDWFVYSTFVDIGSFFFWSFGEQLYKFDSCLLRFFEIGKYLFLYVKPSCTNRLCTAAMEQLIFSESSRRYKSGFSSTAFLSSVGFIFPCLVPAIFSFVIPVSS
jgi:hypothetical protein